MVEVVIAVVACDGRVLMTQRPPGKDFAHSWECPGGKVEGNESHHQALRREIEEELGAHLAVIEQQAIRRDSGTLEGFFLLFYRAELAPGSRPTPREGQGVGWFTADEMRQLTLAPGNQRALEQICAVANFSRGPQKWLSTLTR